MSFETINPRQAFERTQKSWATYVDVRTQEEFSAGHATGAVHIPLFVQGPAGRELNQDFLAQVGKMFPKKDACLVIGCASGGRSGRACELLSRDGYTALANIDGGFSGRRDPASGACLVTGWKDEGLPVDGDSACGCHHG